MATQMSDFLDGVAVKSNNPLVSYFDSYCVNLVLMRQLIHLKLSLTATGGVVTDYQSGVKKYRAHVFTFLRNF